MVQKSLAYYNRIIRWFKQKGLNESEKKMKVTSSGYCENYKKTGCAKIGRNDGIGQCDCALYKACLRLPLVSRIKYNTF